ncbi:MAG TPA: type I glyceraldehyde-3-phosphate dehydrogenase [Patescibacteria group bacterium]|nr:type I glyceraldehyde-3-phosphate dehydrogenase [Patescibacteria group bacterium]
MIKVAINGYGRIGRVAHRVILAKHSSEIEVVAINAGSSTDLEGWMYLLKYDTNYGSLDGVTLEIKPNTDTTNPDLLGKMIVDGKEIHVYSQKDASLLPWEMLGIDVVIESTGHLLTEEKAKAHIQAGAKSVVMSAPAKDETPTYVMSINDKEYTQEPVINNASCTTNCITPVAKVMEEAFGIEKAMMTTIHGYTSDQKLQDGGHKDYRRARSAAENIIPTSTGATKAAAKAFPALQNKFNGLAIRVPVPVGSLSDFTFLLKKDTTVEEVNEVFKKAASHAHFKGIIEVTEDPIVSSDVVGNSHSSIVDLSLTQVVGGNMVKVIAWYDNEWGYANRLVEEVLLVGGKHA